MFNRNEEEIKFLDEYNPIIKSQSLSDTDIVVLGEYPDLKEKYENVKNNNNNSVIKEKDNKKYFEEIKKNKETAKKKPKKKNQGTEGKYYISKKNRKGDYVWMLLEKK